MNKIKISALIMSLSMAVAPLAQAATFTDMPEDAVASVAIENAVKNGLISGYEDNTVRPDNNIRRSEMAVIITQACKVTKEGDIAKFVDVKEGDWFYSAMAKAYEMGAFSGDDQNRMNPNNNITFQECFTVLSQVFDLVPEYVYFPKPDEIPAELPQGSLVSGKRVYNIRCLDAFSDKDQIAKWAIPYVAGVVNNGGWNGVDGQITPTAYITRAQFAMVLDNLIKNYIDEPGTYTKDNFPTGATMIRCNDVILDGVVTDSDIYVGDSVEAGKITVKDITANKRFVVRGCVTPELDIEKPGITATGSIHSYRAIRPFINSNISGVKLGTAFYAVKDCHTSFTIPGTENIDDSQLQGTVNVDGDKDAADEADETATDEEATDENQDEAADKADEK